MIQDQHAELVQGSDQTVSIAVTDPDTGGAVNLTGAVAVYHITTQPGGGEILVDLSSDGTAVTIDGAAGTVSVDLARNLTSTLPTGRLYHELGVTDSTGDFKTVMQGHARVKPSTTRGPVV